MDSPALDVNQLLAERDGYKSAYEIASSEAVGYRQAYEAAVSERVGAQQAYVSVSSDIGDALSASALARSVYEATAAELRGFRKRARLPASTHLGSHFLILANGRTGSTWLSTSFDQLPNTVCRKELRWRSPQTAFHGQHGYIDQSTPSLASAIEAAAPGVHHAGSKLVFDPYWYSGPEIFADLAEIAEPHIRFIILKRRYADVWTSWKVRGVFHRLRQTPGLDQSLVDDVSALAEPSLEPIHFSVNGQPLGEPRAEARPYSLSLAVDDLLVLFANDIACLAFCRGRPSIVADYADLDRQFQSLAAFIGVAASSPVEASTEKLPDVAQFVSPREPLDAFADCLDAAFWSVARGETSPDAVWSFLPGNRAHVGAPGFWELAKQYGLRQNGEWPLMKPVVRV